MPLLAQPLRIAPLMTEVGHMVGALSLVLGGIVGMAFLARRFLPQFGQPSRAAGSLQHLGLLSLTPQCSIALVQAGQEILVLGLTPQTVTLLTKAGDPVSSGEGGNGETGKRGNGETERCRSSARMEGEAV